jgi:hypothetical protein
MTPSPEEPVYRSWRAALEARIRGMERELDSLRGQLAGDPHPRRRRWVALGVLSLAVLAAPLGVIAARRPLNPDKLALVPTFHSAGWTLTVTFPSPARCLGAILEHKGSLERVDCMTRHDNPSLASIGLTFEQATRPLTIIVDYELGLSARRGSLPFDPAEAKTNEVKQVLSMVPQWVEMTDRPGRPRLFFTTLVSYGFGLSEIRYGFDDEPASRHLRFTSRDRPGVNDTDELYCDVPSAARSVTVEVVFADGTTSMRHFPLAPPPEH